MSKKKVSLLARVAQMRMGWVGVAFAFAMAIAMFAGRPTAVSTQLIPPSPTRDPSLVLALGFDEGTGTKVYDSSGHGYVGDVSGATWTQGRFGGALSFDGVDDKVTVWDLVMTMLPTATLVVTATPTQIPTVIATEIPTSTPTEVPTSTPTEVPTATGVPSATPTGAVTATPTRTPRPTHTPKPKPPRRNSVLLVNNESIWNLDW